MNQSRYIATAALALLAGACTTVPVADRQTAPLIGAAGNAIGTAQWWADEAGIRFELEASGLTPGLHGLHFHQVGRCDGPDFKSAGGHWNPTSRKHGHHNTEGWHAGDLGNLEAVAGKPARFAFTLPPGMDSLADADGTALVIHAKADDEITDPSGNSGDRIACAVIAPAK